MDASDLTCGHEQRRDDVQTSALYGLDYVEVSDDQLGLDVFFLGRAPPKIEKANLRITGGRRIGDIRVTDLRVGRPGGKTVGDYFQVEGDRSGGFSPYTLSP